MGNVEQHTLHRLPLVVCWLGAQSSRNDMIYVLFCRDVGNEVSLLFCGKRSEMFCTCTW